MKSSGTIKSRAAAKLICSMVLMYWVVKNSFGRLRVTVLQWGGKVLKKSFGKSKPTITIKWTVLMLPHFLVQQTAVKLADETQELYSFTGDYNNNTQGLSNLKRLPIYQNYQENCNYNAFEDCHHQDAFLQHIYEIYRAETEPSIKLNQPFAEMAAPY